jgi:hypothetical protein
MKKIKDTSEALSLFEEAAIQHAEATKEGDHKTCNKSYTIIFKAVTFLKERDEIIQLSQFLNHTSMGVRTWAATYLLPTRTQESIRTLEEIVSANGLFSFEAKMVLSEWREGNLKVSTP